MRNVEYFGRGLQEAREEYGAYVNLIAQGHTTPTVLRRTEQAKQRAELWEQTLFNSTPLELASEVIGG